MRKITLMLMAMAIIALQSWATPVDESTARSIAQRFLSSGTPSLRASGGSGLHLLHVEMGKAKVGQPVYYIYNTSTTFLVIAGDDRAEEILMVGDRPLKEINNLAPGMKDMLSQYKEEIEFLHEHPGLVVDKRSPRFTSGQDNVYGPLLTALWNQDAPFWNQCVFDYEGTSYQCYTGCPATSSAQVLYYWKYPTGLVGAIDAYTSTLDLTSSSTVDYTYPELPATTFDWDNMKDSYYNGYTPAQGNAVAKLMRYVGQAVEMMYGTEDAGGSGIYSNETQKLVDMFVRFGYDATTCQVVFKSDYTEEDWATLIQNEMIQGRPVVYMGVTFTRAGHAFNVDGYDGSVGKYHVNFGWSGEGNAWCAMNSFAYSGYTFSRGQQAVIGIQPPGTPAPTPELTVTPAALSFTGCATGGVYSKTFTVMGSDLHSDLTVMLDDPTGNYSIDKTSISRSEAASGATVTVNYHPVAAGTSSASVTISGDGVDELTVSLQGEAFMLSTSVDSIDFGAVEVGYPVKKYLNVSANDLTSDISLRIETRSVNYYKVSPETITPEQAASGVKVTVTYSPGSDYWTDANLILSSPELEDKVIPITADPFYPDCFYKNETVSFDAYVGQQVTTTGAVRFADAEIPDPIVPPVVVSSTGDGVTFNMVSGLEGIGNYDVTVTGDPAFRVTIVKASALANICTVRISYWPTSEGTHQATVTLYCSTAGVPTLTFKLKGTASILKAEPVLDAVNEDEMDETSFDANWCANCYEAGIEYFTIECAPQDAGFDSNNSGYQLYTELLPEDCYYNGMQYHVVWGLGKKYGFTISDLTPGITYCYRVKTIYTDGTESDWSNVETVTIPGVNGLLGDVDNNGSVGISDITILIDALLSGDELPGRSDVNGDGIVNICDVTDLIDLLFR